MTNNNYLSISDYDKVVKNLTTFAKDQSLKTATPMKSQGLSNLYAFTGGFSRVYKININNQSKALRCWHKDPGKVQKRFPIVSDYLSKKPSPYFVDIKYIPNAMSYNKNDISVSLMDWIEGDTLSKFLEKNINSKKMMSLVANEFLSMVSDLHKSRIAHGDLQTENIIISRNNGNFALKLIDYDSLYIPSLPNEHLDDLVGLPSFQHPNRKELVNNKPNYFKADYFSELVIFLSLYVYAEQPRLWVGGKERLLFDATDFEKPNKSAIFSELLRSKDPQIALLAKKLKEFCGLSPNNLLPLEDLLDKSSMSAFTSQNSSQDLELFFQQPVEVVEKTKNSIKKDISFENIFNNPNSASTKTLRCKNGHKQINPNDIYCLTCNDKQSFFGPSQICPRCHSNIPKLTIRFCPQCGRKL